MSEIKNELIKNHLLEPGGAIGIHGEGYPESSIFYKVDIRISNDKKFPIMIRLTETGLSIDLVRNQ